MKIAIICIISIVFSVVLVLTTLITVDRCMVAHKMKNIHAGMTGHQVQDAAKCKLKVISITDKSYHAQLVSPLHFFKYTLLFKDGRLKTLQRM